MYEEKSLPVQIWWMCLPKALTTVVVAKNLVPRWQDRPAKGCKGKQEGSLREVVVEMSDFLRVLSRRAER